MRKQWIAALGILVLALAIGGWAEAAPVQTCLDTGNTEHIVDTAPEAAAVGAGGYFNTDCHLIIKTSLTGVVATKLLLYAGSITIMGPDVLAPPNPVSVDNETPNSELEIAAKKGNITIFEASIKARTKVVVRCQTSNCMIDVDDSELIASITKTTAFAPPFVGDLFLLAQGDIDSQTSTLFGLNKFVIISYHGNVTVSCPGGSVSGCQDPVVSSRAVELCGTCPLGAVCPPDPRGLPLVFPCTVTFATQDDISDVCFKDRPGVTCGGGGSEGRIQARKKIDLHGSTIKVISHLTIQSTGGCPAPLPLNPAPDPTPNPTTVCINLEGALLVADDLVILANSSAGANSGVIDLCGAEAANAALAPNKPPQAAGATVLEDTGGVSTINGDTAPPWSRIVGGVETIFNGDAECAAPYPDNGALIDGTID
ncbi:hypothetical protein [Candidatus Methylomirabilis sp.]|uniref:hypothetical protein n=1 Tax=Candidatus Methylomirabilis sp. TaxID=2032687 RepID=UPI0030764B6B